MDDKSHCPLPGGRGSKPPHATIQSEWERERRRRVRTREQSDAVSSTPERPKRSDEASSVPCKVPRFQYVDFPSLHQCIRQLSVPPLESWLAGCRAGRPPPGLAPGAVPKERAPKFKYVDYPSLYHCIQQLSVPPLESWSSGLPQPRSGDGGSGARATSQTAVPTREDQATQTAPRDASHAACQGSSALLSRHEDPAKRPNPGPNTTSRKRKQTSPPLLVPLSAGSKTVHLRGSSEDQASSVMQGSCSGPSACLDLDGMSAQSGPKATRPSVISLHPGKETPWKHHQGPLAGCPTDSEVTRRRQSESVCPLCQKVFAGPQELREHQESHYRAK
ncbi:hypothetical protein ACEWY4_009623 [Coilia grayii]|uniref:C2H2-type domain-containing protein n=1 Tax=Coilia grayii TaxID=363190 RepID=A0ABD1K6X4_9TELE